MLDYKEIIKEVVDIEKYPFKDELHLLSEGKEISLGDLHGNILRLLFALVKHGVIDIAEEDYQRLVEIYNTERDEAGIIKALSDLNKNNQALIKNIIDDYLAIINRLTIAKNVKGIFRLMGDDAFDRGLTDYLTMEFYPKIYEANIKMPIMVSNHGFELLLALEKNRKFKPIYIEPTGTCSAINTQLLIDNQFITRKQIEEIVEKYYKPNLKLLDYTLSNDKSKIFIYSHGKIGINAIRLMADKIGVCYEGDEPILVAKTIENINKKFQEEYVQKNIISSLFAESDNSYIEVLKKSKVAPDDNDKTVYPSGTYIDERSNPFIYLIWNRSEVSAEYLPAWAEFIHGHTVSPDLKNVTCLDGELGKFSKNKLNHTGEYKVTYVTGERLEPDLKENASLEKLEAMLSTKQQATANYEDKLPDTFLPQALEAIKQGEGLQDIKSPSNIRQQPQEQVFEKGNQYNI